MKGLRILAIVMTLLAGVTAASGGEPTTGGPSAVPGGALSETASSAAPNEGSPGTGEPVALFRAAGSAYEAGRYAEAAADYQAILAQGYDDPRLYYNLGNARFKEGKLGPAILAYERALARDPSDTDARENLAYAALLTTDKVGTPEAEFPAALLAALERWFAAPRAGAALAIFSALGALLAVPLWLGAAPALVRPLRVGVATCVLLALLSGAAAAVVVAGPGRTEEAIVLADSADGRSAPASDGTVLFTVHEGLKVEIRGERPGWLQIALPNGLTGWIEEGRAERI